MAKSLRQLVRDRAQRRCEYCQMPEVGDVQPFQLDHIRATKHSDPDLVAESRLELPAMQRFQGAERRRLRP